MKRILLTLILLIVSCAFSFAQLETAVWYFGHNAGLDFNTPEPRVLTDGVLDNWEGVASFSDEQGNLLFYTDGRTIWNRNHQPMLNGENLLGDMSSTESAIIVPWPERSGFYFVFVVDAYFQEHGLSYSVVDMSLDGGLGGVVDDQKNIQFEDRVAEKVTAVKHSNNVDYWLITREVPGSNFVEYRIDKSGIVLSSRKSFPLSAQAIWKDNCIIDKKTNELHCDYDYSMAIGYMRVSPDGRRIAVANMSAILLDENEVDFVNILELLNFDPQNGTITNFLTYYDKNLGFEDNPNTWNNTSLYGVEFADDASKLYFTNFRQIYQMDLTYQMPSQIVKSITKIGDFPYTYNKNRPDTTLAGALQLAINGKIYIALDSYDYLAVIENPREPGDGCNFVLDGLYLDGRQSGMGLPNFIPSYFKPAPFDIIDNCIDNTTRFACNDPDIVSCEWILKDLDDNVLDKNYGNEFSYKFQQIGQYRILLNYTTSKNEKGSDFRIFSIFENPRFTIHDDQIICSGDHIVLDPVKDNSLLFWWQDYFEPDPITISSTSDITGWCSDIYTKCISSSTVHIEVVEPEQFSLGPDLEFCEGGSVDLLVDLPEINIEEFWWVDNNDPSTKRTFSKPGTYSAKTRDTHGCEYEDFIEIIQNQNPKINMDQNDVLCENEPRIIDSGIENVKYLWQDGSCNRTVAADTAGLYKVMVTDSKGCISKDSIYLKLKTVPKVSLPADTLLCDGQDLMVSAYWPDADNYLWQDMCLDSTYLIETPGVYSVVVSNQCGSADDRMEVRYRFCGEFEFPNIITPNGDGINDFFRIKGLDEFTSGWHLEIFNREGRRVFYSENYTNSWNAPDVSDGVYFYRFYRGSDSYKGNITVFHR